jgi:hypothetical protein
MSVNKLYDIPAEVERFEQILIETAGELTPELEQEFAAFIAGSKDKIEAGCMVMRNLEAQEEASAAESKRLYDRAHQFKNSGERLKGLILYAVDAMGGKVKTALFTTWGQNAANRTSVELKAGADLVEIEKTHPQFVRVKREINLEAVQEYLKNLGWKPAPLPAECEQCRQLAEPGRIPIEQWIEHHPKCTAEAEADFRTGLPVAFIVRWIRGKRFLRVR